jgi:multidrug efflux pump subunit AcrB
VLVAKDLEARDRVQAKLEKLFPDEFPDVTVRISRLELGPPVGWPVQYRVSAPTTDEARQYAEQVATMLRASGIVRNVNYDWTEKSKALRIVVDQERVRQAGLSSEQLAMSLNRVINGSPITQLRDSIYLVNVIARADSSEGSNVEALRNLQIITPTGASVPLRQLAQFQYELDEGYVWRRSRLPTITVQAEPQPGLQPAFVHQHMAGAIEELSKSMPAGTVIATGGTVEKSEQSNIALIAQFPLMITLMLTALIVQLGSFRQLAMVISVAPLGLIGVVVALLTTRTPMGFIAILGIIALAGMIIRNSVILVDQIEHERARGIDPWNAVIDATMHRFRPIMLTAAAAILGMIPIMHDVFWGPMAYAIVGGLAVATVLTLVFLPALYVAVNGVREKEEPATAPDLDVLATPMLALQH